MYIQYVCNDSLCDHANKKERERKKKIEINREKMFKKKRIKKKNEDDNR